MDLSFINFRPNGVCQKLLKEATSSPTCTELGKLIQSKAFIQSSLSNVWNIKNLMEQ